MTGIHDLLDEVSSGQPTATISVDGLVRSGRRRQRRLACGVAVGAAGVVVAAVVPLGVALHTHTSDGTAIAPDVTSGLVPQPSAYAGPRVVLGPNGAASSIPSAQLLLGGRTLQTEVDGPLCAATEPLLVIVQQSSTEVRVRLMLTGGNQADPESGCGTRTPAAAVDGASEAGGSQYQHVTLDAPLGRRRLVDDSTDATIPYQSAADSLVAQRVPAGFVAAPLVGLGDGWSTQWTRHTHGTQESLNLSQFASVADRTPPRPTDVVNGAPAVFLQMGPYGFDLRWKRGGQTVDLDYTSCAVPTGQGTGSCEKSVLTKAELLAVADSVGPRS